MSFDTEWRRIFHGRDVEETRAYLRKGFGDDVRFDPARRQDRRIDVRSEGIDLPSMFIHQARLSAGFAIEGRQADPHYVVFLPLRGCIEASALGSSIVCDPRPRLHSLPADHAGRAACARRRRSPRWY